MTTTDRPIRLALVDDHRMLLGALTEWIRSAADDIEMTVREAKNSARQESSSDSSPLPSEAEASTASTPAETRAEHPGSSHLPFPTLSQSSVGTS